MKTTLLLSIFLNGLLLAGLALLWIKKNQAGRDEMVDTVKPVSVVTNVSVPARDLAEASPLAWVRFYSPDYHIYVKNLREAGCPEVSVKAIVTADAEVVFGKRRRDLEQKLSGSAGNAEMALRAELEQLPDEEASVIAELLGYGFPDKKAEVAGESPQLRPPVPASLNEPVCLPLVFQDFAAASLGLNPDQEQMIATMRQNFLDEIGGANQDPNDPNYRARWQQAQPAMDNMLQGMLGSDVFIKFQMLQLMAANQAAQSQQN